MWGEFIAMRMRMRRVPWWKRRFFDCFMGRMGERIFSRMMPGIFQLTFPVLAGACFQGRI